MTTLNPATIGTSGSTGPVGPAHSTRTSARQGRSVPAANRAGRRRSQKATDLDSRALDVHIAEARTLVEEALRFYHAAGRGRTGDITALDLARNVQRWTHTTRLRDFVRTVLTGKGNRR